MASPVATDGWVQLDLGVDDPATELRRLAGHVERFGERHELSPRLVQRAELVLEELVTNVLTHGLDDTSPDRAVKVHLRVEGGEVHGVMLDSGRAFDPTRNEAPRRAASLEEVEPGGMGLALVRRMTRHLAYLRDGSRNRLEFVLSE